MAHPVLGFHLPLSAARASAAQRKCPTLICLILSSIPVGDQRTDGLAAQLFILEIIQFFQETVPELAGPSVDFELYIGRYTIRADMGNRGGGVILCSQTRANNAIVICSQSLHPGSFSLGHEWGYLIRVLFSSYFQTGGYKVELPKGHADGSGTVWPSTCASHAAINWRTPRSMSWPTWLLSHKVSVPDLAFTQPRFDVWIVYQIVIWPTLLVSRRFSPDLLIPSYRVPFRSFRSLILTL